MSQEQKEKEVWLVDAVLGKVVEKHTPEDMEKFALNLAGGYFEKGDGKPESQFMPTPNDPKRHVIDTPTDYFVIYRK